MAKRILGAVILIGLMLHGAGRTGMLSYLYQQRHVIAFSLGITNEVLITICGSSYLHDQAIAISAADEGDKVPPVLGHAQEIILFCCASTVAYRTQDMPSAELWFTSVEPSHYQSPSLDIFQPPRV